jgi:hypothetical protein
MHIAASMRTPALALVFAVSACSDASARLEDARDRWRGAAIADYSFDYRTSGFVAPVAAHIAVRGGAAVAVQDLETTGFPLQLSLAPTIETLFDTVARQLEGDVDVRVTWDPALGYPAQAYFDAGEEGDGFTVSAFRSGS